MDYETKDCNVNTSLYSGSAPLTVCSRTDAGYHPDANDTYQCDFTNLNTTATATAVLDGNTYKVWGDISDGAGGVAESFYCQETITYLLDGTPINPLWQVVLKGSAHADTFAFWYDDGSTVWSLEPHAFSEASPNRITGTQFAGVIQGANSPDFIQGSDYTGSEYEDRLSGGNANDTIYGRLGGDICDGEAGNDIIIGGGGDDTLNGGTGNDTLNGGTGDDYINAGPGNDLGKGGPGDDDLTGDEDSDILCGEGHNVGDNLRSGAGTSSDVDVLWGVGSSDDCMAQHLGLIKADTYCNDVSTLGTLTRISSPPEECE